jgi:hypothetical protein
MLSGDTGPVATPGSRLLSRLTLTVRGILVQSAGLYLRALLAALAAGALFFLLSYASTFVDRQGIVAKLESANARQSFRQTWAAWTGRAIPRFGGNDCVIIASLLQDYPSRLTEAISARILPPDAQPPARAGEPTIPACQQLIAALERTGHADPAAIYYHRYLHGQRVIAALALAVTTPEALGWVTLLLNIFVLLSVLVPALRRSRSPAPDVWRQRGFAAIAAMLLLFDALWLFGIYFTYSLSDLVLSVFLAYGYHRGLASAPEPVFAVAVALFGVATAIFEFLTGGIPFGLALLLGIVALDGPADATALWRRAWHGSVIFALAVMVTFALKVALVTLLIDPTALAGFRGALAVRVGGQFISSLPPQEIAWVASFGIDVASLESSWVLSVFYMLARLGYATFVIGYGSPILGMAIVGLAVITTIVLLFRGMRGAKDATARTRLGILFASALVMPAWSLVFINHTLLHAIWMVRPFAWYVALAGLLMAWPWPVSGERGPSHS